MRRRTSVASEDTGLASVRHAFASFVVPPRAVPTLLLMKLIIQIPCLNEEETLPATLADLPREVAGLRRRSSGWSSTTAPPTARSRSPAANGVDHIVRLTNNKGLAAGFQAGLDACLKLGADVIVNTDADNQYDGARHPQAGRAHRRGPRRHGRRRPRGRTIEHFSPLKKRLQRPARGSCARRPGTDVPDTTSGFRAYNREAAIQMAVVSKYTYTLETIIQAGKLLVADRPRADPDQPEDARVAAVPVDERLRPAQRVAITRIYTQYEPLRVFLTMALVLFLLALVAFGALRRRLHRAATAPATCSR